MASRRINGMPLSEPMVTQLTDVTHPQLMKASHFTCHSIAYLRAELSYQQRHHQSSARLTLCARNLNKCWDLNFLSHRDKIWCPKYCSKGRVRIRKSKSGEKWNFQLVDDAYEIMLYRCCTSKFCSYKCQILHYGCALKRERWVS